MSRYIEQIAIIVVIGSLCLVVVLLKQSGAW
jgi:hypothetical protein